MFTRNKLRSVMIKPFEIIECCCASLNIRVTRTHALNCATKAEPINSIELLQMNTSNMGYNIKIKRIPNARNSVDFHFEPYRSCKPLDVFKKFRAHN